MKKKLLIGLGVLAVAAIVVVAIYYPKRRAGEEVYIARAEKGEIASVVSANGAIQARTKVNISSNIPGEIRELPVKEGDVVRKGQVLVRLDQERYLQAVRSLEASLKMARIAVEEEQTRNRTLATQYRRAEALREQGILPQETYDQARLNYEASSIRLKSLEEAVSQAAASLAQARDQLAKTVLYAPMDGKITQLNTEVGEQVIVGTTNIPGSVIMVISDMSEVLAEADVDETEVVRVQLGQSATVTVDAIEGEKFKGSVTEIRNTASKKQEVNVFGAKIQLEKPDERIRPGMSARARIDIEKREGVLRIPIQAVVERTEKELAAQLEKSRKGPMGRILGDGTAREPGEKSGETKPAEGRGAAEKAEGGTGSALAAGGAGGGERAAGPPTEAPGAGEGDGTTGRSPEAGRGVEGEGPAGTLPAPDKQVGSDGTTAAPPADRGSGEGDASGGASAPAGELSGPKAAGRKLDDTVEVVYVMRDGKAEAVRVKTGLADETYVEVLTGLKENDQVITGPYRTLRKLKHGDKVVEKEEEEFSAAASSGEEKKEE